jgi:hypothetical protein
MLAHDVTHMRTNRSVPLLALRQRTRQGDRDIGGMLTMQSSALAGTTQRCPG